MTEEESTMAEGEAGEGEPGECDADIEPLLC